jgi:sugar phosphate isomerase/epimerase
MNFLRTFSSLGCPDATLDSALRIAADHGVQGVELRALEGTVDLPAVFAKRYGTPAALAARVASQPIRIVALDTSLKLCDSDDAAWRGMEGFLPWAEALGGVRLRVFDGGKSGTDDELAAMAKRLEWWRAWRAERGWTSDVMIETHDSLFCAAKIRALAERASAPPVLWDSHHTWKRGGEDPVATWREIRPLVVHIHVKDSISVASARHPFSYVLPGQGEFPMAPLREALAAEGYEKPLSLEWERLWHPTIPPLEQALAAAQGWW